MIPGMLAACDPASAAVSLSSDAAVVAVYDARTGAWERGAVGELEVGDEVLHDGHLLRVTDDGVEDRGFAEVGQLSEADTTWTVDGVRSIPDGDDWVLVLGDGDEAGHWRLDELVVGERFAFGGRVFETGEVDGGLAVRATGDVLGRVYKTHIRKADVVIDLVVSGPDGDETITGTPEHPFWVEAVGDYVAMGDLEVGTVLRSVGGGEARVATMEWRAGEFEVFNFEVEGVHNYFVSAPGGGDGVLVHNGCGGIGRGLWKVTKQGADKMASHKTFGTFMRNKSDGLWWAKDNAGHGGSKWKVFRENKSKKQLEWVADADDYGDFIDGKHKGRMGKVIPFDQLKIRDLIPDD